MGMAVVVVCRAECRVGAVVRLLSQSLGKTYLGVDRCIRKFRRMYGFA